MSKQLIGPNSTFKVNGTDLSVWVRSATVNDTANPIDVTGWSQNYIDNLQGIRTAQITGEIVQDFAAGGPDVTLAPLYYNRTAGTIKVNPDTNGTVVYTMIGILESWSPVQGAAGDANIVPFTFNNSGTAGLTRGTS